jgi:O-methyltransferase
MQLNGLDRTSSAGCSSYSQLHDLFGVWRIRKMIKKWAQKGIRLFLGYDVRRVQGRPPEMSQEEWQLIEDVIRQELTMVSRERLCSTLLAAKFVVTANIEGAFVECGVWRGGNSIVASRIFQMHNQLDRWVYLYDTFAGMTQPKDMDYQLRDGMRAKLQFEQNQVGETNLWSNASVEEVRKNFNNFGLDVGGTIRLIKGDILLTLKDERNLPEKISVLRLDTDWYESTMYELEVLFPRLSQGGILIIDDYGDWAGAKKAVDEYFLRAPRKVFFQPIDYTGRIGVKV